MPEVKPTKDAVNKRPPAKDVEEFHTHADRDGSPKSLHHTLGPNPNQASPGNHSHDGGNSTKLRTLEGINITGARGGNTALASVIAALVSLGATDSTTA